MQTIDEMRNNASALSEANRALGEEIRLVEAGMRRVREAHRRRVDELVDRYRECHMALVEGVKVNPALFGKPKSQQAGNVKYGYRKLKGKTLLPADTEKLIERLRSLMGDECGAYLKTTETPIVSKIAELPGSTLKRLGVTIEEDRDVPFVAITEGDVAAEVQVLLGALTKDMLNPTKKESA